jgi:hypothetical protein
VQGYNALGIYDGANCWMRRVGFLHGEQDGQQQGPDACCALHWHSF